MARFTSAAAANPDYGWENLGLLYATKLLTAPGIFYCGSVPMNPNDNGSLAYYENSTYSFPYGAWAINPPPSNQGIVRSGYGYFPQNKSLGAAIIITGVGSVGSVALPVINPQNMSSGFGGQNAANPINKWSVAQDYKESAVDPSKAISTDNIFNGLGQIYHKKMGGSVAGINALFGDGHVRWQQAGQMPILFNPNGIFGPSFDQSDERYLMYSWQP